MLKLEQCVYVVVDSKTKGFGLPFLGKESDYELIEAEFQNAYPGWDFELVEVIPDAFLNLDSDELPNYDSDRESIVCQNVPLGAQLGLPLGSFTFDGGDGCIISMGGE